MSEHGQLSSIPPIIRPVPSILQDSLQELGVLLERKERELGRQLFVISDEPYARIVYDGIRLPSVFASIDNAVIVTSHSKDLALPGERIGYLAANPRMTHVGLFIEGAVFLQPDPRFRQCSRTDAAPCGEIAAFVGGC